MAPLNAKSLQCRPQFWLLRPQLPPAPKNCSGLSTNNAVHECRIIVSYYDPQDLSVASSCKCVIISVSQPAWTGVNQAWIEKNAYRRNHRIRNGVRLAGRCWYTRTKSVVRYECARRRTETELEYQGKAWRT
jgi:hypothetical protein